MLSIELKVDQEFKYETEWIPFQGKSIKLSWKLKVTAQDKDSIFLEIQQGTSMPLPMIISRQNAIVTRPPTSPGTPTKIWRIIEGLLPAKKGESYRNKSWVADFFAGNDSEGNAAMQVTYKRPKTYFSYREGVEAQAIGECIHDYKLPLPPYLKIQFTQGTTFVLKKLEDKKKEKAKEKDKKLEKKNDPPKKDG